MQDLSERDLEIVTLRERDGLTFQALGEQFGISANRASQIYRQAMRKQREKRRDEYYLEENKKVVTLNLTLAEITVLHRILLLFVYWLNINLPQKPNYFKDMLGNVDYVTASTIAERLAEIERTNRDT